MTTAMLRILISWLVIAVELVCIVIDAFTDVADAVYFVLFVAAVANLIGWLAAGVLRWRRASATPR